MSIVLMREMRPLFPFLVALLSITFPAIMSAEKPFSFKDTPGKLPKEVVPTDYSIRILSNIDALKFSGTETVKLDVRNPVHRLVLNALEMEISEASLDGKVLPKSAIQIDSENELLILALPSEVAAGNHRLALSFSGKINQQGQGLFYMRYREQGSPAAAEKKFMLGTQFEATDARRFFPCWDERAFRARFHLTTVVPENWVAVSNMPIESEKKIAGGKEVRFAATPSMPSYLNVFVAGELDLIESRSGPTQIRVITTKGKAELGRYALEATAQILQYYNDYFGVPYPLPKLDQIALPGAFDDITYKKCQSFLRMLESFLGEDVFRDGIRRYIAAHEYSNSTTADLWSALSEASKKPVGEIAAGWTQQPGFPIIKVKREADGKVRLTQERFTVNFKNAPPLEWKIPLTYTVIGQIGRAHV